MSCSYRCRRLIQISSPQVRSMSRPEFGTCALERTSTPLILSILQTSTVFAFSLKGTVLDLDPMTLPAGSLIFDATAKLHVLGIRESPVVSHRWASLEVEDFSLQATMTIDASHGIPRRQLYQNMTSPDMKIEFPVWVYLLTALHSALVPGILYLRFGHKYIGVVMLSLL